MSKKKGKKKTTKRKTTKRAPKKKARKKARKTTTSRKTTPRRRRREKKPDTVGKLKKLVAAGFGAGIGAVAGPAAQTLSKQTGIAGEVIAAAVPIAVGGMLHHQGAKNFGGGMMAMGAGLLLLSGFRRIKSRIPGLEQIDMGPLGNKIPKIYSNAGSNQLLIRGNDGVLHRVPQTGDFGTRKTVRLPSGERITGQSLGVANINGEKFMPLYLPSKGELKLIRLGGTVARSDAFGACGGECSQIGGAVARSDAFGGAVKRADAFGQGGKRDRRRRLTTGYTRSAY